MCVSFLLNRESSVCRGNSNRGYSPLTFWSWLVCAFVRRVNLERKKKKGRSLSNEKQERIHNQMLAPKSCCGTWWIEPVHLYSVSGSVCNTRLKINHSFFLSSFHYWHCTGQIQKRVTAKVKWICFLFAVRTAIKLCGTGMCWFLPHSCQIVLCKTETKHVWISWHMFTATACTFCIYTHVTNHLFD